MPITDLPPASPRHRGGAVPSPSRSANRWLIGVSCLAGTWAAVATGYILLHDEVAQTLFARQTELRYGYEDQISDLKNRLEREITANLVERRNVAVRTEALSSRQAEIETRQAWIRDVVERLGGGTTGALKARETALPALPATSERAGQMAAEKAPEPVVSPGLKPEPLANDEPPFRLRTSALPARPAHHDRMVGLEAGLRGTSETWLQQAESLRRIVRDRAARIRTALDATRLDARRFRRPEPPTGGPLVPIDSGFDAGPLAPVISDTETGLADLAHLQSLVRTLPLGRPLAGALEPTSGFGYRLDPFTRGAALHTGIDFRGEAGSPVRATAAGRVTTAEYTGGYGNLVEVEHEGGVSTRYGHLSAFLVAPGQVIEAGQAVGRVGSTGRSTGYHLHYETRIDGEPINPVRFLEASRLLADASR